MHNSLFIRELLKESSARPLRRARHDPHRLVAADPAARGIAADASDFLTRMGIEVLPTADRCLTIAHDPSLYNRDCRFRCMLAASAEKRFLIR